MARNTFSKLNFNLDFLDNKETDCSPVSSGDFLIKSCYGLSVYNEEEETKFQKILFNALDFLGEVFSWIWGLIGLAFILYIVFIIFCAIFNIDFDKKPAKSTTSSKSNYSKTIPHGNYRCSSYHSRKADNLYPSNYEKTSIENQRSELEQLQSDINHLASRSNYVTSQYEYNLIKQEYDSKVLRYNTLKDDFNYKINKYNSKINQYNSYLKENCR